MVADQIRSPALGPELSIHGGVVSGEGKYDAPGGGGTGARGKTDGELAVVPRLAVEVLLEAASLANEEVKACVCAVA